MQHIAILILFIACLTTHGQTSVICDCNALVDVEFKGEIVVFDKPAGRILKKNKHNLKEEDFVILTIEKEKSNYFYADISHAITQDQHSKGWIRKTNAIGIYLKNYSQGDQQILYTSPNLSSKINSTITEWTNQLFTITKCKKKWAYVKIKYKGHLKEGWLQPDKQCANPYTTCN
ncbi:MAG: hypothetical protein IPJ31_00895 [Bacteroidetes bacterium]|nr:hypothetical protein [Bacteroidota bacterium]